MARIGGYAPLAEQTSKFGRIRAFAKRWGWPRTIFAQVMKLAGRYLGIHIVRVRGRHTTCEASAPIRIPGLELRQIEADELMRSTEDPKIDLDRNFVEAAIERGDIAFGAFEGSLLVGHHWRSTTGAPHTDELWVRVRRPHCYSYKSFTRREYRGNHILPALILYADWEMLQRGYSHRVGYIDIRNYASLAMGKHLHSYTVGYAGYVKWFGRHFTFRSRAVAETGFEFFEPAKTV